LEAVRYHPDHPLHAEPTHDFDAYVKEIMEAGNVWEHQTGKALAQQFDGVVHRERDDPALRVRNSVWSGHIDFLIEECADLPGGAIIIPTYLSYRSWSNWAEPQVWGYGAHLLMAACKRRLRGIVKLAPAWITEEILSASERIGDDRTALWTNKN
jgi:hypothetical protein